MDRSTLLLSLPSLIVWSVLISRDGIQTLSFGFSVRRGLVTVKLSVMCTDVDVWLDTDLTGFDESNRFERVVTT